MMLVLLISNNSLLSSKCHDQVRNSFLCNCILPIFHYFFEYRLSSCVRLREAEEATEERRGTNTKEEEGEEEEEEEEEEGEEEEEEGEEERRRKKEDSQLKMYIKLFVKP